MKINNQSHDHTYFTMIPNMIFFIKLSPYAVALYAYIKQIAGENSKCWKSEYTMAHDMSCSRHVIQDCKGELERQRLIKITPKPNPRGGRPYHEITIVNIWKRNAVFIEKYKLKQTSKRATWKDLLEIKE